MSPRLPLLWASRQSVSVVDIGPASGFPALDFFRAHRYLIEATAFLTGDWWKHKECMFHRYFDAVYTQDMQRFSFSDDVLSDYDTQGIDDISLTRH